MSFCSKYVISVSQIMTELLTEVSFFIIRQFYMINNLLLGAKNVPKFDITSPQQS